MTLIPNDSRAPGAARVGLLLSCVCMLLACGKGDPAEAVTENITFSGGTVVNGAPPAATNSPGDPVVQEGGGGTLESGGSGSLPITFSNVPPNTAFDVNVQFDNAPNHIKIPISASTTQGQTSGTLNIPFNLNSAVCNNLGDVQHQIKCYESVSIGGVKVSKAVARQMVLNCQKPDQGTSGAFNCSAAGMTSDGEGCCSPYSSDGSCTMNYCIVATANGTCQRGYYTVNGTKYRCPDCQDLQACAQAAANACYP